MSEIIINIVESYPILASIIAVMGTARLFIKPLMSFAHEFVIITESKKDDEILKEIEESKYYKWILYVLDWFASIKVKK